MAIRVLDHPLAGHLLALLREESTPAEDFRRHAKSLALLLILEATHDLRSTPRQIQTPVATAEGRHLDEKLAVVPVLRAGLSMMEPALDLFPDVTVGYIGMERSEADARARSYYCKLPDLEGRIALCLDPMLATGGSACQALSMIAAKNCERSMLVCVVAAPEGIRAVREQHPAVTIVTAAIDRGLDDRKFIVPGLGDFGDRLFGTA